MTMANTTSFADGSYFYEIWGEEPTGIKGDFAKVKSIAALEEEEVHEEEEERRFGECPVCAVREVRVCVRARR